MKLENQVCSPKLSKKLAKLGVKQDSAFYWWTINTPKETILAIRSSNSIKDIRNTGYRTTMGHKSDEYVSAFTVAELGELLPSQFDNTLPSFPWLVCTKDKTEEWEVGYCKHAEGFTDGFSSNKNEADARAGLLIFLLERNFIKLKNPEHFHGVDYKYSKRGNTHW